MKRIITFIAVLLLSVCIYAGQVDVIYKGPTDIGNWGTIELSSIKFHNLEIGDTIYIYTDKVTADSKGAFQDFHWKTIPGAINGQVITGDYEFVVKSDSALNHLKQYGLKIRGYNYVVKKVVIKHNDHCIQTILLISAIIISLLIILAIIILIYKNRQLSKANLLLYGKNMDVLASIDQERRMKARYEGEIAAFKELFQNGLIPEMRQKYQSSSLANDDKAILQSRISNIFENTEEIYEEDFNMQKLAKLVGSNYKNVSQVINELMGKNFNQLLNEHRIQEACRRFNNPAVYGNYTVEAIGNSVGYSSRSTFVTQFKMVTGLTPSEFQKMSKNIH